MAKRLIRVGAELALAALFLYSGVVKIWDFQTGESATQDFYAAITNYQLIPFQDLAMLLAIYLPWLEIAVGLALLIRRGVAGSLLTISSLFLVFTSALASAWARHLDISCGCFGAEVVRTNYPVHLAGTIGGLLLASALLVWEIARAQRPAVAAVSPLA